MPEKDANRKKKTANIVLLAILAVVAIPMIPFASLALYSFLQPTPPRPAITYGEFPFRLVYELNGEEIVIEDTIICEFDGYDFSWGGEGRWRKWKSHYASGNERIVLLAINNGVVFVLSGSPEYYMGDSKYGSGTQLLPTAYVYDADNWPKYLMVGEDELLNAYGIKLISWEPSPPIVNSFK